MTNRRSFLKTYGFAITGAVAGAWLANPLLRVVHGSPRIDVDDKNKDKSKDSVTVISFDDGGQKLGPTQVKKVRKTKAEWKQQLTPLQFEVTREAGTERAFTGEYAETHDKGLYRCICCGNALFSSDTKFESGTGWPSFWAPIAKENVRTSNDFSLVVQRIEVTCAECEAHLGHVFDDGPKPTGLRYCMNSASLRFIKHA